MESKLLIEESEALSILNPYLDDFRQAMVDGWNRYKLIPQELRAQLDTNARATCVHDFQVHDFRVLEERYEGLHIIESRKLYVVIIDRKIAMRIKKIGLDRLPRNQPSKQVEDFRSQRFSTPELKGVPEPACLELGYTPDLLEQEIEELFLLCPNGPRKNYWEYGLFAEESAIGNIVDLFGSQNQENSDEDVSGDRYSSGGELEDGDSERDQEDED